MKKILILFILTPILSVSQQWSQVAGFISEGRHHPITFSNDNFGFVMSGSYLEDAFRYNKSSDTWTQLDNIPFTGRGYSYAVSIGDKAYMGFGYTSDGEFPTDWWEYDMNNDSWLQLANFPGEGRQHPAMVVVNNKIYMGCGGNQNGNLGDWWEYDVAEDVWEEKSNIICNNRHHPFYFGIGNYAYVGFGHGSLPGPGSNISENVYIYNDFYRYDPSSDTWIQLADFPSEARVAGTQFSYDGSGYILSGDGDDHNPLSDGEFWKYNPSFDTWSQLESHPCGAIWAPGSFLIGCDVYFLLGQNWNTNVGLFPSSVYKYKLSEACGCTDPQAYNFSILSNSDDGSCCYLSGCTDPLSINYDSFSCYDDGSCITPIIGCTNETSDNFDSNANTTISAGGALANSFGEGSFFSGNQHLVFNSYKQCVIKSAKIYSQGSNTIKFELRNSNGNVIEDTILNIITGEQQINLQFNVPIDDNMQLGVAINALESTGLYRNNSCAEYPYNIGSAIEILSSSADEYPFDYYYFFYNIEVEIPCQGGVSSNWECIENTCVYIEEGTGTYSSVEECASVCEQFDTRWDCIDNSCISVDDGTGTYASVEECASVCEQFDTRWDCVDNSCISVDDGTGTYSSIEECASVCEQFDTRWDCIDNSCISFGDGTGAYANIEECEQICNTTYNTEFYPLNKRLVRIVNVLGQEINTINNETMFYIYDDGTVEKIIIID
jgi:N-acetylneuraminic acid mutarotase